jgi:sugar lactone lactonase YvrE
MTLVSLRTLVTATAQVGEGPVWVDSVQQLLWVDIDLGQIHSSGLDGATTTVQAPTMERSACNPATPLSPSQRGRPPAPQPRGLRTAALDVGRGLRER